MIFCSFSMAFKLSFILSVFGIIDVTMGSQDQLSPCEKFEYSKDINRRKFPIRKVFFSKVSPDMMLHS